MAQPGDVYPPRPFSLPAAEANALELLADQLVVETLRASDDFIAQGRRVDQTRWKVVKEKNNMAAYRPRKRSTNRSHRDRSVSEETEAVVMSPQMPSFYPSSLDYNKYALSETYPSVTYLEEDLNSQDECSLTNNVEANVLERSRPARAPLVFCTGVVPGTIEDVALGFLADSEAKSRTRSTSSRDVTIDDIRILARINGPTDDDPFRFLGVKWCSLAVPGIARRFVNSRDYLVLESTGAAFDYQGKRYCYWLNHSIKLDEVPDFQKFGSIRLTLSACHVVRPHTTTGEVDVYTRGFMDPLGSISEHLCTAIFCQGLLTVPQVIEEAYMKKLSWLLRKTKPIADSEPNSTPTCRCCLEKFQTGFAKILEGASSRCCLCMHPICRKSTVKKVLPTDLDKKCRQECVFCLHCYVESKKLSARTVARRTFSENSHVQQAKRN